MQTEPSAGLVAVADRGRPVQLCRRYWDLYDAFAPLRQEAREYDPTSSESAAYETFAFIHHVLLERLNDAAAQVTAAHTAEGSALVQALHACYYSLGVARHYLARQIALAYSLWDWEGDRPRGHYGTLWQRGAKWHLHDKLRALADGGDAVADRLWEAVAPTREVDGWYQELNDIRSDMAHNATALLGRLEPDGPLHLVNVHLPVWHRLRYGRPADEGGLALQPEDTYPLPAVEQAEDLLRKVCALADAVWGVLADGIREGGRLPLR